MGRGHEVGVGGRVVHNGPGVVVLVDKVDGLHFVRRLVVVALIEHGGDETLVEILGQQVLVVGRDLALIGTLVAEFDGFVPADARQVSDDARGDAEGIGRTLEEEGAGGGIYGHNVVGIGQEQFLLGLRLVVAVEISIARSYLHIGVEGQQDGRSRHVDFRQFRTFGGIHIDHADGVGSAALIRQANVSIRALGIALDVDSARGHIEGIVFILGELALAESNLERLARGVHLDSRGGIDHVAVGIKQAHGLVLASGHLDVAAEGDGDILQFRQLRTCLRRNGIAVEQVDALGNLRYGIGERGYVAGVGIDHDGHGAPIFADINWCARVLKASMLEEVVAKLVLQDEVEVYPIVAVLDAPLAQRAANGRGAEQRALGIRAPSTHADIFCPVHDGQLILLDIIDEGQVFLGGETGGCLFADHVGGTRDVAAVVGEFADAIVVQALHVGRPALGVALGEAYHGVVAVLNVVDVFEAAAEVVGRGHVTHGHAGEDGLAISGNLREAVLSLVLVRHILGGKAGRIDQLARGEVPEGGQFLIDIVGKGLCAHSVFAIGRHGKDEATRAASLDGQSGPGTCGFLPVGRLTIELAHHNATVVGYIARRGTGYRGDIHAFAEVGGQARLQINEARIHTQGRVTAIHGIKNGPLAIVGHAVHHGIVVEGQRANGWIILGNSNAQAACHHEQEHQHTIKDVGSTHISIRDILQVYIGDILAGKGKDFLSKQQPTPLDFSKKQGLGPPKERKPSPTIHPIQIFSLPLRHADCTPRGLHIIKAGCSRNPR